MSLGPLVAAGLLMDEAVGRGRWRFQGFSGQRPLSCNACSIRSGADLSSSLAVCSPVAHAALPTTPFDVGAHSKLLYPVRSPESISCLGSRCLGIEAVF